MFDNLKKRFGGIPKSDREIKLTKQALEEKIIESLVESDASVETAEEVWRRMQPALEGRSRKLSPGDYAGILRNAISEIFEVQKAATDITAVDKRPYIILFLGINGTGKTTTIAKVAKLLKDKGKRVVIAASDTFRAGAIDQISIWGERLGITVIKHQHGSDPSAVAFDAINHAVARKLDYVLIDTAGRMQTNKNLIEEMKKIRRVSKPDHTVAVIDAMAGQDAINQAKTFMEQVSFDSIIVTKLDTDAKGGSMITMAAEIKKPILYVCMGQEPEDIMPFSSEWFLDRILPQ
ncbi:MAG: signal recognition particle-docking protein FtsY [Candidatus Thermoplasmatota archaeon]|jgi:fused signal recognition particle receptor|nr:signal recognition particle-docking protein FtsY [Candidatus Thermoplasmatota archaeon]MCL5793933.1 signal recognition particle-docking protein FtsY [Candidatus Thermoplasmatota archaeon]